MRLYFSLLLLAPLGLAGCVSYQAKPLRRQADLQQHIPVLTTAVENLQLPSLPPHRFDPSDGLDGTEVAMLAVANNPELKLVRDDLGVTRAEAFAAGLLPDPQLSLGADIPTNPAPGSSTTGLNLGLNYDLRTLLTRDIVGQAAAARVSQADLNLLWQEWQTASQARLLYARVLVQGQLLKVLRQSRDLLADRYRRVHQALQEGNVTLQEADADLAALEDSERQLDEQQRTLEKARLELNRLLGLAPQLQLPLAEPIDLPLLDETRVRGLLSSLARRRPDLLALQAGYHSSDLAYRKAILEQFPSLNIGLSRARDTSNVQTVGVGVTLDLPLFNRNRGPIAVAVASRQRLYDEYQLRLNRAHETIVALLDDQRLLVGQLAKVRAGMRVLKSSVETARQALAAGSIDEQGYLTLATRLLDRKKETIQLEELVLEQRIALQTLLGTELPVQTAVKGKEK